MRGGGWEEEGGRGGRVRGGGWERGEGERRRVGGGGWERGEGERRRVRGGGWERGEGEAAHVVVCTLLYYMYMYVGIRHSSGRGRHPAVRWAEAEDCHCPGSDKGA